jgi:hypothetical protein
MNTFKSLKIGQTFDWINPDAIGYNTFFKRCMKTSSRGYTDADNIQYKVGSINAKVYHVQEDGKE